MPRYAFFGHASVGAYVARCLEPYGWVRADDASDAAVVFTYFAGASALEDAYFEDEGLVKRSRPGTLLVDLSPSTPSFARELSAIATVNDLRPVEAPIAVSDPAIRDPFASPDNILCFAAGEEDDVDEVIDLLETIASHVERTGGSGTAQLARAAHTVQAAALVASAVEADALVRATCNATASLDGLTAHVRPSFDHVKHMLAAVAADGFSGTYTIEMLLGEVAAAMAAADDVDLILPQLESVMHLLEVITVIGGADKAPAALSLMYREEADSAANGLDWTRAEDLFSECGHDHDCGCGCDHDHDHGYDHDYGIDEDDGFGFAGGFGGYSAN